MKNDQNENCAKHFIDYLHHSEQLDDTKVSCSNSDCAFINAIGTSGNRSVSESQCPGCGGTGFEKVYSPAKDNLIEELMRDFAAGLKMTNKDETLQRWLRRSISDLYTKGFAAGREEASDGIARAYVSAHREEWKKVFRAEILKEQEESYEGSQTVSLSKIRKEVRAEFARELLEKMPIQIHTLEEVAELNKDIGTPLSEYAYYESKGWVQCLNEIRSLIEELKGSS